MTRRINRGCRVSKMVVTVGEYTDNQMNFVRKYKDKMDKIISIRKWYSGQINENNIQLLMLTEDLWTSLIEE